MVEGRKSSDRAYLDFRIGGKIKMFRESFGMDEKAFADRIGVREEDLRAVEAGGPADVHFLQKITKSFSVRATEFFDFSERANDNRPNLE